MNQYPVSLVPGSWIVSTPTQVASGSHERRRKTRLMETWTAVTAVELGIRPLMYGWDMTSDDLEDFMRKARLLVGGFDPQARGRLDYYRQNARRARLTKSGEPPELREKVYRRPDGVIHRIPHPRTAIKQKLPPGLPMHKALTEIQYGEALLRDNPFALLEEFIPPFSNNGLCMRWSGNPSGMACTLLFQKTCFDAKSADAAEERLAKQVDELRERWLLGGPKPLVNLWGDPVKTLLPGEMGWVGEFQLRSPESPGYGCEQCDQKIGHCPTKVADVIRALFFFKDELNLDFLVTPGFSMDPRVAKRRVLGYELRLRISTPSRPTPDELKQLGKTLQLQTHYDNPVLRDHHIGPKHPQRTARVAAGASLGPSIEGIASPPLTANQVVNCLPWPRRR